MSTDTTTNYIAYYRVSTKRQGTSGLGLEAQKAAVLRHVNGHGRLVAEFTEVESGRKNDRPQLAAALRAAKECGGTLIIAKLDRLARRASVVFQLRDSGVQFKAADNPHANHLTVGLLAVIAEDEARRISERTKAALAAAKARGTKLGNPQNLNQAARDKAAKALRDKAANLPSNRQATELAKAYRAQGLTLQQIADRVNSLGIPTPRGKQWQATSIMRLLKR